MINRALSHFTSWGLIVLLLGTLLMMVSQKANANKTQITSLSPLTQTSVSGEVWKLGFTIEDEASYETIIGKILDKAVFRTERAQDIYYIFPSPANLPTVKSAQFKILEKTGSYDGEITLTLEILESKGGALRHTVSTAKEGWELSEDSWTPMPFSRSDLKIAPDEFLAFHFQLRGDKGGDLDLRPEFEVEVVSTDIALAANDSTSTSDTQSIEIWRSGFTIEGTPTYGAEYDKLLRSGFVEPGTIADLELSRAGFSQQGTPTYDSIKGRLAGVTAAIRSDRSVSDIHYIFPAPTIPTTIQSAKFHILSDTGSYTAGDVQLTFIIYDFAGTLQHELNKSIDLKTVPVETWISVADLINETIQPTEFLAARVEFTGGSADNLDMRLLFEVEAGPDAPLIISKSFIYLPHILK